MAARNHTMKTQMKIEPGRQFRVVVNGRRYLNGQRYALKLTGQFVSGPTGFDLYGLAAAAAERTRKECREMEYPDSLQITVFHPMRKKSVAKGGGKA